MKRLTAAQRRDIREILEETNCAFCKHLVPHVGWWCGNESAIKARGTRMPGVIHCPYFKIDKDFTRKVLKIKKPCNMKKIAKIVKVIICLVLSVVIMQVIYNVWSTYGSYAWLNQFSSLLIYGGVVGMIYWCINWVLNKIWK